MQRRKLWMCLWWLKLLLIDIIRVGITFPWEPCCQSKSDIRRDFEKYSDPSPPYIIIIIITNIHVVQSLVRHKKQTQSMNKPCLPHVSLLFTHNSTFTIVLWVFLIPKYVVSNVIFHNHPDLRLHFTLPTLHMSWKRLCGGYESKVIVIQLQRPRSCIHVGLLQRLYE